MCTVIRLVGVSIILIILIKMEQGNKWIERKQEKAGETVYKKQRKRNIKNKV